MRLAVTLFLVLTIMSATHPSYSQAASDGTYLYFYFLMHCFLEILD
jgi:hypothetical protein